MRERCWPQWRVARRSLRQPPDGAVTLPLRQLAARALATGALSEPSAEYGLILRSRTLGNATGLLDLLHADAEGQLLELPPRVDRLDERRVELDRVARKTVPIDAGELGSIGIEHVLIALSRRAVLGPSTARGTWPSRRFSTSARVPLHGLSPPGPTGLSRRTRR